MLPPMNDRVAVKVLIVNDDGQYLAGTATHWEFTDNRSQARVFDYLEDRVAETIDLIRKAHGRVWIAVKLDPREVYEFCDRCGCGCEHSGCSLMGGCFCARIAGGAARTLKLIPAFSDGCARGGVSVVLRH